MLNVTSISVAGGAQGVGVAQTERSGASLGCELRFERSGADRFGTAFTVRFRDGATQTHSETFAVDAVKPSISFDSVRLAASPAGQLLVIAVQAADDVDLSFVEVSATALRASDLRSVGGIVDNARSSAFAATEGRTRIYPSVHGQHLFELALPVKGGLSAAEIAHNGLVLIDASAVDASGNQASFSKLAFTGQDVVETVTAISAVPERIVFTSLIETAI